MVLISVMLLPVDASSKIILWHIHIILITLMKYFVSQKGRAYSVLILVSRLNNVDISEAVI